MLKWVRVDWGCVTLFFLLLYTLDIVYRKRFLSSKFFFHGTAQLGSGCGEQKKTTSLFCKIRRQIRASKKEQGPSGKNKATHVASLD